MFLISDGKRMDHNRGSDFVLSTLELLVVSVLDRWLLGIWEGTGIGTRFRHHTVATVPCSQARSTWVDGAQASHLLFFLLDEFRRACGLSGHLVSEYKKIRLRSEVVVDIFKSTSSRLRIEEVREWNERSVEDGPDDVEFPVQGLDADLSDFDDHEVEDPV